MSNIDGRDLAKLNNVPDDTNASLGAKVDKVTGKSLISDTEITRLASVTNQTLSGLGGEDVSNKKTTLTNSDTDYPTTKVLTTVKADVDGRIDDLGAVVIRHESEIASLENTLNSTNINQETTATVTGVDTIALPKTAANTGMQVKMFGQSASEEISFSSTSSHSTLNVVKTAGKPIYAATATLSVVTVFAFDVSKSAVTGEKYYARLKVKLITGTYTSIDLLLRGSTSSTQSIILQTINIPVLNTQYSLSGVGTLTSAITGLIRFASRAYTPVIGDIIEYVEPMLINLTATYGAGNEPTKEQCDLLFANYFEGTDNVLGTGRVRSVGKNLFDFYGVTPSSYILTYTALSYKIGDLFVPTAVLGVGYGRGFRVKVQKNVNYSIIFSAVGEQCRINVFGENTSTVLVHTGIANAGLSVQATFNSGENEYIIIGGQKSTTSTVNGSGIANIQLERSATATTYEPYRESVLQLTTPPLRSNGLIKDEIRKGTNGYELVKRVGVGTSNGNIITGGDFSNPADWSVAGGTSEISNGTLKIIANAGSSSFVSQSVSITAGKIYRYSINAISGSGVCYLQFGTTTVTLVGSDNLGLIRGWFLVTTNQTYIRIVKEGSVSVSREFDNFSITEYNASEGAATGSSATELGSNVHYTLATPVITPIAHAGLLNSNSNGTAYFEPIIADAGVYSTNLAVQLTDYPINALESIRKYTDGTYTELNTATAVIAGDGLSFTHPDLVSGDLVMFTYAYANESIGRSMILSYWVSNSNPYYNVTNSIPLTTGYYASTTARAAVPEGVRKTGLILTYETAAGVWYTERYIGTATDTTSFTTASNWEIGVLRMASVTDTTEYAEITI